MPPKVSLFDQAADKLREAMSGSASGLDRMRLIEEALALYHRHQDDLDLPADDIAMPAEMAAKLDRIGDA